MMQWWNNATVRAFRDRAQCIVDQYSRYKLQDITSFINGRMTQGENIADNGGLKQAFRVSLWQETSYCYRAQLSCHKGASLVIPWRLHCLVLCPRRIGSGWLSTARSRGCQAST